MPSGRTALLVRCVGCVATVSVFVKLIKFSSPGTGMEELTTQLDKLLEKDDALMVQVILRLIEQKPGFKDANFQVMQKVLQTITRLAKSQFFTKSMAELVLAGTWHLPFLEPALSIPC
jgi:hypothetical protein